MASKGGGYTREENGTVQMYIQSEESNETVLGRDGNKIAQPNYVMQSHEIGHAYYKDVLGVPYQGCKAIDVENDVRQNNGLPLRQYEKDGKHDFQ